MFHGMFRDRKTHPEINDLGKNIAKKHGMFHEIQPD